MSREITQLTDYTGVYNSGGDVDDRHFQAEFEQIIAALNKKVRIVDSLPASGEAGETIILSTDFLQYVRNNSGEWVAANGGLDLLFAKKIYGCDIVVTGTNTFNVTVGALTINGKFRKNTSVVACTGVSVSNDEWIKIYAVADADGETTFTVEQVAAGTGFTGSPSGTNTRLIGAVKKNANGYLSAVRMYKENLVLGWDYMQGNSTILKDVSFLTGVTLDQTSNLTFVELGTYSAGIPTTSYSGTMMGDLIGKIIATSATAFKVRIYATDGTLGANYLTFKFAIYGGFDA